LTLSGVDCSIWTLYVGISLCQQQQLLLLLLFWIFLPNFIKINPYNFELCRFKVCAFFWDTVYYITNSNY